MSTGLCIISSACTLQPVKYLRWHEECWSLAYLSRRYSLFKRLLKSRTHIDLHQTGPASDWEATENKTMWSLQNAVSNHIKTLKPAPAFTSTLKLSRFFEKVG